MRRTHRLCFPSLIWNAVAEVRVVLRLPISVGLLRLAHPRTVRRVLARNRPLRTQTAKRVQCAFCKMEFCSFYLSPSSADDKCKAPAAKTPRLRHRALRTGRRSGRSSAARNVEAAQARRSRLWLFARSANAASRLFVPVAGDGTDERAQASRPSRQGVSAQTCILSRATRKVYGARCFFSRSTSSSACTNRMSAVPLNM